MWFFLFSLGCTPAYIEQDGVTKAVSRGDVSTVCVGLSMKDPSVRTYATEQIRPFVKGNKADQVETCICEALPSETEGWDSAVVEGLVGEKSNKLTRCFSEMVAETTLPNRIEAIEQLGKMYSPVVLSTLRDIAGNEQDDAAVRAKALLMIGGDEAAEKAVFSAAASSDVTLRAAALEVMGRRPKARQFRKFLDQGLADERAEIRRAAVGPFKLHVGKKGDKKLCDLMMNDPDGGVRKAAVSAFKGVNRKEAVSCLNKRSNTLEEDPEVRDALLDVLKSAMGDAREPAFAVLCDSIPFWLRSYITDDVVTNIKGAAIVKAQNDIDHENSARCFHTAYKRSSGYSCYAKMHIALWHAQMIGKEDMPIPLCPGMEEYSEAY